MGLAIPHSRLNTLSSQIAPILSLLFQLLIMPSSSIISFQVS